MNIDKQEIQNAIDQQILQAEKIYGKDIKFTILSVIGLVKLLFPKQTEEKPSRLIPLSKWNEFHGYPTVGALRQYYFNREINGFGYCVEYGGENGTRILINEDKYFEWQHNRRKKPA